MEEYLHYVGCHKGDPWCAAYISWVFGQAGYPTPRTGWSPDLFPAKRIIKMPEPGSVMGIYFASLRRIAHCGIVERVRHDWVFCLEGNTDGSGGREGDGVYLRIRHKRGISKYSDWTQ